MGTFFCLKQPLKLGKGFKTWASHLRPNPIWILMHSQTPLHFPQLYNTNTFHFSFEMQNGNTVKSTQLSNQSDSSSDSDSDQSDSSSDEENDDQVTNKSSLANQKCATERRVEKRVLQESNSSETCKFPKQTM